MSLQENTWRDAPAALAESGEMPDKDFNKAIRRMAKKKPRLSDKQKEAACNVMPAMCKTCPFKEGSPYAFLKEDLTRSALTANNRICHSTGTSAICGRTGTPERICRGARNAQLEAFHAMGLLPEPTDEAWKQTLDRFTK